MVAAWMSAETGVGPAMASGSHVKSGIWALTGGPDEEQQDGSCCHATVHAWSLGQDRVEVQSADLPENDEHGQEKSKVPDPVHDEGLVRRLAVVAVGVPETDQQVGAQPNTFPAQEQDHEVIPEDQVQHGEDEQVQVGEKAPETIISMHVAHRIHMDEAAHARDDHGHQQGELIKPVGKVNRQIAGHHPSEGVRDDGFALVSNE